MDAMQFACRNHLLAILHGEVRHLPKISFPNSYRARAAVILSAAAAIEYAWHELQDDGFGFEQQLGLVFKLAAYVSKTGITARQLRAKQDDINFAVLCFRSKLSSPMGLGRMLKQASFIQKRNAIELQEDVGEPVEIRRSACGRFKLVELKSSAHLVAEGEALRHCMAYRRTDTGRLWYFEEIRQGRSRVFSLRRCGRHGLPSERIATVELDVESGWLTIEPGLDALDQNERWHCLILLGPLRGDVVPWVKRANRLVCLNLAKRKYV